MATDSTINTDFLRFSAYSFKDLLTRKMSENTKFTDQVYEGSNLAILIDLCAYLFLGLTYCINIAAAESMFADTLIYNNINRLVKLIGYNPKGFIPSEALFSFFVPDEYDDVIIPKYTAVDTKKTDGKGRKVYYSFNDYYKLAGGNCYNILYNGRWKMYHTIFTATGVNYETFTLDGVRSDGDTLDYVAHGCIDVYVKRNGKFILFKGLTDEIFMSTVSKYDGGDDAIDIYRNTDEDRYFSIRLNEDKTYEIKFGNDNNGLKLEKGDQVYVLYLDSNGFDASLTSGELTNGKFIEPTLILGITDDMLYKKIFGSDETQESQTDLEMANIKEAIEGINSVTNTTASTVALLEESVDDVRNLAPGYYKLGNRLITKNDFEYYVKNRYADLVIDVKCQNNWEYMSSFFGWLYNLGKNGLMTDKYLLNLSLPLRQSDAKYYLDEVRMLKYDYKFADPADLNNVYIWCKMQNDLDLWKNTLDEDTRQIKVLTSELVFVDPIPVQFALCAAPIYRAYQYLQDLIFDEYNESYIEITISDNSVFSNTALKSLINSIILQFFKATNMKLGQVVDINALEEQIYAINGVERIRTVFSYYKTNDDGTKDIEDKFVNGLSFASWSSSFIDTGDDLDVTSGSKSLEVFLFPVFYHSSLTDRITIIKRSFTNTSTIQY